MKLFRSRKFLGFIGLLLAVGICFGLQPAMTKAENRQVSIVRVTKSIPEGTAITKDMVTTVSVGGYNLPADIIKSDKEVLGKYTTAKLEPGDYILAAKISDKMDSSYLSNLDGEKEAISISIKSFAAGLSGKLQSGDIVSLIVSSYGDAKQTFAPPELRYVKLLAATTDKGHDVDQIKKEEEKDEDKENNIPSTLTLLVNPEQATKLVDYETNGKLYATLVYRGSEENSKKYLDIQDEYLKGIENPVTIPSSGGDLMNGQ